MRLLIALLFVGCSRPNAAATKEEAGALAPPAPVAAPEPTPKTAAQQVFEAASFTDALALARPEMEDTVNKMDDGTLALSFWAAKSLRWSDVVVAKNETSFAAATKDSDEERGRRLCVSGSIIQIEVAKTKAGKLFEGLLSDYSSNLYKFVVAGSTGDLVERSQGRMCGVVTGKFEYSNSAGGTGHAIKIVGMFDLPTNRATAIATARSAAAANPLPTAAPDAVDAPAHAPPKASPSNAACNPPFTVDEKTGRKNYKLECL